MILTLLSCQHALRQMDDYLDHELSPLEMKMVRGHLRICHACEKKFAFEAGFAQALRERFDAVATLENSALTSLSGRVRAALDEIEVAQLEGSTGEF